MNRDTATVPPTAPGETGGAPAGRLRFGITSGIPDLPGRSHAELYRDTIRMVEAAEAAGFDTCWFTEHHFSRHGIDSAVLTLMAALAERTSRIRLGTAVSVLPFWNPVRLAEEVAVVDILSDGRFDLGIGSGYRIHEFTGLGADVEQRTPVFFESVEILDKVWSGEPFTYEGQFYRIDSRGLRPLPVQKPHPPYWVAAQSEATVRWTGENRAGWMCALAPGQTIDQFVPARDLYLSASRAAGGTPTIYFQTQCSTAKRPTAQIRAEMEPYTRWWFEAVGAGETIWNRGQDRFVIPEGAVDSFFTHGFHGDPDHILRQIEEYAQFGVTDFAFQIAYGPPIESLLETIETFATEILPHAQKLKPVEIVAA